MPTIDQTTYPTENVGSLVEPNPVHAVLACLAIIAAWDGWTDESPIEESRCDDVLQSAVAHAAAILKAGRCPTYLVEELNEAVAVITADPNEPIENIPNLTFDEAIAPLRLFVAVQGFGVPL